MHWYFLGKKVEIMCCPARERQKRWVPTPRWRWRLAFQYICLCLGTSWVSRQSNSVLSVPDTTHIAYATLLEGTQSCLWWKQQGGMHHDLLWETWDSVCLPNVKKRIYLFIYLFEVGILAWISKVVSACARTWKSFKIKETALVHFCFLSWFSGHLLSWVWGSEQTCKSGNVRLTGSTAPS